MSRADRRHRLKAFLTALKRVSSGCRITLQDLEHLLEECLLCHGTADLLGVWFPNRPLWAELDVQRVVTGQPPRAEGKTPSCVYSLCTQCADLPESPEIVERVLLGRSVVLAVSQPPEERGR